MHFESLVSQKWTKLMWRERMRLWLLFQIAVVAQSSQMRIGPQINTDGSFLSWNIGLGLWPKKAINSKPLCIHKARACLRFAPERTFFKKHAPKKNSRLACPRVLGWCPALPRA